MNFGGRHTRLKLEILGSYLNFYVTALKNRGFHLVYIDAFAGTGDMLIDGAMAPNLFSAGGAAESYEGSVRRAIKLPFDSFWLVEKDQKRYRMLKENLAELAPDLRNKIKIHCGDSDEILRKLAPLLKGKINGKDIRAVIFLDPFGMSLSYETMKALGDTKVADIWFLVPTGMGALRQAPRTMRGTPRYNQRITKMLGTDEWQSAWYTKISQQTLDGDITEIHHRNQIEKIEEFILRRINTAFNNGGMEKTLTLGRGGRRWYKLMFACSNPSRAARELAYRAADHILTKAGRS